MGTKERKSSRGIAGEYYRATDYLVDQFRQGNISERECRSLYDQTLARMVLDLEENFHNRVELSRGLRTDATDSGRDASPVSGSDG